MAGLLLSACNNSAEIAAVPVSTPASTSTTIPVASTQSELTEVVMYKSPTCGCCGDWADHLRKEGFTVIEHKRDDMDVVKNEYGVSEKLSSCHTALIGGYIIEGHVPAADIQRLLKERPQIAGLTAPGMPIKSPGMQAVDQEPKGYDVLAFNKDGSSHVFTHY